MFELGLQTIPQVMDEWLKECNAGDPFSFHTNFIDELPLAEDRTKMLQFLAAAPKLVKDGLIDTSTGLVYRYSSNKALQWASLLGVIAVFFLAARMITFVVSLPPGTTPLSPAGTATPTPTGTTPSAGTTPLSSVSTATPTSTGGIPQPTAAPTNETPTFAITKALIGWPVPENAAKALFAWVALIAGIFIHIAVSLSKQAQANPGTPPALPVAARFLPLVNARFSATILKLVLALFSFFGLAFAKNGDFSVLNFFLGGYALDSLVELFGSTADARSKALTDGLAKQFKGTDASTSAGANTGPSGS